MDAYVVSKYVKKSLLEKNKKIEHADFIMPNGNIPLGSNMSSSNNNSANGGATDLSTTDLSTTDLSTTDLSTTDLSTTNISITNIDVTNINDDESSEDENDYKNANMVSNNTFILMLIINSYAAYLSWICNTKNNYPLPLKLVFAFFSFMFGSLYVIYYMLFRFDTCNELNV